MPTPTKKPQDFAPFLLGFLFKNFFNEQKKVNRIYFFAAWLTTTAFCILFAFTVSSIWLSSSHKSGDSDFVNDLGQAYAILIGLLLTVYLERSVEKRRRVTVAHITNREPEKTALDEEAIPRTYTLLVFYILLIYCGGVFPLQRLSASDCTSFPCIETLGFVLVNVFLVSGVFFLVFFAAFSLQFKALELEGAARGGLENIVSSAVDFTPATFQSKFKFK